MAQSETPKMFIGVLSKRTGCNIETIRFYERIGVMPKPPRTEGGHRVYTEDHFKRLTFIRRSRQLGFSLDTVRALLGLADGEGRTCKDVERIANRHLREVRAKLDDLAIMDEVLSEMVSRCAGGTKPECPLIEALFEEA